MASNLEISFKFEGLDELRKAAKGLGKAGTYAMYKATDEVGNKAFTLMKRAVADQAGVSYDRAGKVMSMRQAMGAGQGSFLVIARDATMSLKEFKPRQTNKGVSAAPWKKRRVFPHSFIGPNGHVFVRRAKRGCRSKSSGARRFPKR